MFSKHAKYLAKSVTPAVFIDHLTRLNDYLLVATDRSGMEEKVRVEIYAPFLDFCFTFKLPEFSPIFEAAYLEILLAQ